MERQIKTHDRALSGFAVDFKATSQFFQARPHIGHAIHSFRLTGLHPAPAVIGDGQADSPLFNLNVQANFSGARMSHDVGQRFLEGEKQLMAMLASPRHGLPA